jgi:hypothetical protein
VAGGLSSLGLGKASPKPDRAKQDVAAWLVQHGHPAREVQEIMRRLERFDGRIVYESFFYGAQHPELDIEGLVYEVSKDLRDANYQILVRTLVEMNLPVAEILQRMQQMQEHDFQGMLSSMKDAEETAEQDAQSTYDSTIHEVLDEFRLDGFVAKRDVKAFLPLLLPGDAGADAAGRSNAMIEQLPGIPIRLTTRGAAEPGFTVPIEILRKEEIRATPIVAMAGVARGRQLAVLRATMPAGVAEADGPDGSKFQGSNLARATGIHRCLQERIVAAHIASPGSLETGEGVILIPGCELRIEPMTSCLPGAVQLSRQFGWPKIEDVSLLHVFRWLRSTTGNLLSGAGDKPLSRALNALSNLFLPSRQCDTFSLLHASAGIDALYSDEPDWNLPRTEERVRQVLGDCEALHDSFRQIYAYRALLARGRVAFHGKYATLADARQPSGPYRNAMYLAAAVLVATLQHMVRHNLHELKFATKAAVFQ